MINNNSKAMINSKIAQITNNGSQNVNKNSTQIKDNTRNAYIPPKFRNKFKQYSFTRISILTLNLFLNQLILDQKKQRLEKNSYFSKKILL